jgi:PAS domain S-box-containing protein
LDLEERAFLLGVAEHCAQALDRALGRAAELAARGEAQRLAARLARLQEITAALSSASTAEEVAGVLVRAARSVLALADPLPVCHAAANRVPVWLATREEAQARFPALATIPDANRPGALAALPLSAGGKAIGAIAFSFEGPRPFDLAERSLLLGIAEQCGVALERARLLDEERRAREAAERAREEADRARGVLDALVRNAPLGIAFFDLEFRYLGVNPRLAEMNGLPVWAHIGRTPREVLPDHPALDALEAAWRRVVETGEELLDLEFVTQAPGETRSRAWVLSWYPVRSESEIVGVGALVREVTQAREAEEFQRHVVGVVRHDLRSPLSAIVNSTAVLLRLDPAPAQERLLGRISASAGRIGEIVGALLDYANVRGGKGVPIRRRRCDLAELSREVTEECRVAQPGGEVRCSGEGDCRGEWDPDRVAQVLTNLVSNALRHAAPGTPVDVRWRGLDGEVVLEVENAGAAIPPELAARLFEPFSRGEAAAGRGVGLGLFIARAIIDAHRGRIDARSGGGRTVFVVRLPRR